jgi:hypothetical protein
VNEVSAFRVNIVTENQQQWSRAFVGRRPTKEDVLATISSDPKHLDYFTTLVQEYWPGDQSIRVCVFAGVTVGRIEIQPIEAQIVLEVGE